MFRDRPLPVAVKELRASPETAWRRGCEKTPATNRSQDPLSCVRIAKTKVRRQNEVSVLSPAPTFLSRPFWLVHLPQGAHNRNHPNLHRATELYSARHFHLTSPVHFLRPGVRRRPLHSDEPNELAQGYDSD